MKHFILLPVTFFLFTVFGISASAMTIHINNAEIDVSVDEGGGLFGTIDSRWFFNLKRNDAKGKPREIRSFHVKGLPGPDVTDTGEYNDFFATSRGLAFGSWPQTPKKDKADSSFVWSVNDNGRNPFLLNKGMVTFGFDSDYNIAQTLATGKFEIGIDYRNGPTTTVIEWSTTIQKTSITPIPLPASAVLLLGAFGLLGWMGCRKSTTA